MAEAPPPDGHRGLAGALQEGRGQTGCQLPRGARRGPQLRLDRHQAQVARPGKLHAALRPAQAGQRVEQAQPRQGRGVNQAGQDDAGRAGLHRGSAQERQLGQGLYEPETR